MKSRSTFYIDLFSNVYLDSSFTMCENDKKRDLAYAKSRFEKEGLFFLTSVLPTFSKAVIRGIETGSFIPPKGFKTLRGSLLPSFLKGWTKNIFSLNGKLKADFDPYLLQELIQICTLLYKLEIPYSKEQESTVLSNFRKTESELHVSQEEIRANSSVLDLASRLIRRLFLGFDPKNIKPSHGPGAVATGETGNGKYSFSRKYQRLHQEFPYYRYFSPSLSRISFESGWYSELQPEINPVAKVVLVPKDSRGPRLISMEPLEIQWIQQGQLRKLVPYIESHFLTKGRINFTQQSFNQQAAFDSSLSREFATLDLKEASDRISLQLFNRLFPSGIRESWLACRSVATMLPDGEVLPLRKFAPMGSALCFPVLAITIWALTEATLRLQHRSYGSQFLVYGDDLIVPTKYYDSVVETLNDSGLLINEDKSFRHSHFRESCGMDAFNGVVVTPFRFKCVLDGGRLDPQSYMQLVAYSDNLFERGFWKTCEFIRKYIRKHHGKVPWYSSRGKGGFYLPNPSVCELRNAQSFRTRYNKKLHRTEFRVISVDSVKEDNPPTPTQQMLKGLLGLYSHNSENGRVALRRRSAFRIRWAYS